MPADALIMEALARVEHKLDQVLFALGVDIDGAQVQFPKSCPLCKEGIDYQMDLVNGVVKRKCGCSTGKQPPLVPFLPVKPTEGEDRADADQSVPAGSEEPSRAEDRARREGGGSRPR